MGVGYLTSAELNANEKESDLRLFFWQGIFRRKLGNGSASLHLSLRLGSGYANLGAGSRRKKAASIIPSLWKVRDAPAEQVEQQVTVQQFH